MGEKRWEQIIRYAFLVFIIFIVVFFSYYRENLPSEKFTEGTRCEYLDTDWYQILEDGSRIPIEVPGQCEADRKEEVVITTILPEDVYEEAVLGFRTSRHDMTILIDGVVRKTYSTADSRVFGINSVSAYIFVPLSVEDAGKELTVRFSTDSSYAGVVRAVYYGEMYGIWYDLLEKNAPQLVLAFFMLIFAIITIIGSNFFQLRSGKKFYLEYLGWGVLLMACWILFQSPLRQLYFRNEVIS